MERDSCFFFVFLFCFLFFVFSVSSEVTEQQHTIIADYRPTKLAAVL